MFTFRRRTALVPSPNRRLHTVAATILAVIWLQAPAVAERILLQDHFDGPTIDFANTWDFFDPTGPGLTDAPTGLGIYSAWRVDDSIVALGKTASTCAMEPAGLISSAGFTLVPSSPQPSGETQVVPMEGQVRVAASATAATAAVGATAATSASTPGLTANHELAHVVQQSGGLGGPSQPGNIVIRVDHKKGKVQLGTIGVDLTGAMFVDPVAEAAFAIETDVSVKLNMTYETISLLVNGSPVYTGPNTIPDKVNLHIGLEQYTSEPGEVISLFNSAEVSVVPVRLPLAGTILMMDGSPAPAGTPFMVRNLTGGGFQFDSSSSGTGTLPDGSYAVAFQETLAGDTYYLAACGKEETPSFIYFGSATDTFATNGQTVRDLTLNHRFGDINGDGYTTQTEVNRVAAEKALPDTDPAARASVDWDDNGIAQDELNRALAARGLRGDFDGDGDVDMDDFGTIQRCLGPVTQLECAIADLDDSGTVDGADISWFTACASGPAVPTACGYR